MGRVGSLWVLAALSLFVGPSHACGRLCIDLLLLLSFSSSRLGPLFRVVFSSGVPVSSSSVVRLSGFGSRCLLVFLWSSLAGCPYCVSSSALFLASPSLHWCLTGVVLYVLLCLPSCCPCVPCLLGHLFLSGVCILCLGLLLWCFAFELVSLSVSLGSLCAPSSIATSCPPSASALCGSCSPSLKLGRILVPSRRGPPFGPSCLIGVSWWLFWS